MLDLGSTLYVSFGGVAQEILTGRGPDDIRSPPKPVRARRNWLTVFVMQDKAPEVMYTILDLQRSANITTAAALVLS